MHTLFKTNKKGIVFGSGGARGLAHLGVWKVLKELGLMNVDYVAGTSMGAIIGAAFSGEKNINEIYDYVYSLKRSFWLKMFTPHLPISGFVSGKRIESFLSHFIEVETFNELKIPFGCSALNYEKAEDKFFDSGQLIPAIRASISIPVIFDPYQIDENYYIDGGLSNPLPIENLKERGIDDILIINVIQKPMPSVSKSGIDKEFYRLLKKKNAGEMPAIHNVALRTLAIGEYEITKKILELHHPEYIVDIDTSQYGILDFIKAKEIILLGENAALRNIDLLKKFISK